MPLVYPPSLSTLPSANTLAVLSTTSRWRIPLRVAGCAIAGVLSLFPLTLLAQGGTPQPDGYAFYWPGACVEAVQRSDAFYWRARQDTLRANPAADTMLTPSTQEARACLAKISTATVPPYALISLARVYLAVGDDAGAQAAVTRRLAATDVQATGPKAWALSKIVGAYLDASLPRVASAQTYLRQLDALTGADAAVGQVLGYYRLALHYWRVGDDSNMVSAAEALIAAGKRLNDHDRNEFLRTVFYGYRVIAEAAGTRTGKSAEPLAVMARARADLGKLTDASKLISNYDSLFALYGTKGARIVANSWIGTPGDTIHPVSGKFALIVFSPYRQNIPAIRRLAKAYDGQLDVTLIRPTYGYFQNLGPLTPQNEAQEMQKYFVNDLHIPGALSITYTEFHRIPDGRLIAEPSANDRAYGTGHGTSVVVLDKQGIIRRIWGWWNSSYENRIDETLQKYGARPQ